MFGSWRQFFRKSIIISDNDIKKISEKVIGLNNPFIKFFIEDGSKSLHLKNKDIYVFYQKMDSVVERSHTKYGVWVIFEKWKEKKAKKRKKFKDFMKEVIDDLLNEWLLSL